MRNAFHRPWFCSLVAVVATCCVLGFYQMTVAQQRGPAQPFANSVEQRIQQIEHLKAIEALLSQQNELLRSGKLKVIVEQSPTR
jgi:hypothetical protein